MCRPTYGVTRTTPEKHDIRQQPEEEVACIARHILLVCLVASAVSAQGWLLDLYV